MPVAVYGAYGFALILIPTAAADYLEYERFQMIDAIAPFINAGKVKVFSINSINNESWMNKQMEGAHKAIRQNQFNEYVFNEVIPFVRSYTSDDTPIITSGGGPIWPGCPARCSPASLDPTSRSVATTRSRNISPTPDLPAS